MGRKPPEMDSPWAWILVIGFTLSSFILGGFINAFGVFFVAFSTKFDASASATSLILTMRAAMYTIVAPTAAVLSERYSERAVIIGSGLFSSLGCMIAAFAPNMATVIFSTGALLGIGMSTFFAPIQLAIGKYFNKKKSIAISLSFIGLCVAQIVMAPLNILMLETYGLTGTLMLYSGMLLNIVVAGALVRPIKRADSGEPLLEKVVSVKDLMSVHELCSSHEIIKDTNAANAENSIRRISNRNTIKEQEIKKETTASPLLENGPSVKERRSSSEAIPGESASFHCDVHINGGNEAQEKDETQRPRSLCSRFLCTLKHFLDFSLLKNLPFLMYTLALCFSLVTFSNIPVFFYPRAEDYHLSPNESALLLTIMGCTDLLSRVLQGIIGDVKKIGPKFVFTLGIFCYGVSSAIVPFTKTFLEMALISACLGLFGSTTITLNMPIIVEIVGLGSLSKGVAITSFFVGITNAIAPPLLGYIKDLTTSYNDVYITCSGILILSTLFMCVEPVVGRVKRRRQRHR